MFLRSETQKKGIRLMAHRNLDSQGFYEELAIRGMVEMAKPIRFLS